MRAFIYPGQGAQSVGMGIGLVEVFEEARDIFDRASAILGCDMIQLCGEGPAEKLNRTIHTQPALFTVEAAVTEVLRGRGVMPDAVAGHSLGEYGAWYASGVLSFEDALELVAERGRLMDGADPEGIGAMSAVIGLERDQVETVCAETVGNVVVANCNSPSQQVISGEKDAVERAATALKEKGAKRVLPLKVSGAFHSPLMAEAAGKFAAAVERVTVRRAGVPVYANVTAKPVTDEGEIRGLMVSQITSPVRWTETVRRMTADGVDVALEAGPGAVLAGLVKRTAPDMVVIPASDPDAIEGIRNHIPGGL